MPLGKPALRLSKKQIKALYQKVFVGFGELVEADGDMVNAR